MLANIFYGSKSARSRGGTVIAKKKKKKLKNRVII